MCVCVFQISDNIVQLIFTHSFVICYTFLEIYIYIFAVLFDYYFSFNSGSDLVENTEKIHLPSIFVHWHMIA